jgi:hypothetical protein
MKQYPITDPRLGRRDFVSAGLITFGAAGLAGLGSAAAQSVVVPDDIDTLDAIDPITPKGLKKNATVDPRYPVAFQRSVPAACRVMTAHFLAINQRDYAALAKTMHYPFAIVESLDTVIVNSPAELTDTGAPFSLNFHPDGRWVGPNKSRLNPGSYDMLKSLEVINFDPVHVNMAMTFDRYNRQGFRTLRCEGIYCVTNNDGKWAIQMMSTIWKPDDFVDIKWPDAEAAAIRLRANHDDSYMTDMDIIDHPRPHRGPRAGITGGGSGNLFGTAASGDQMALFKVKGVKTRLSVRENTDPNASNVDPAKRLRPETGPHVPKWVGQPEAWEKLGINDWWEARVAPDFRILHSWSNKVHRYAGAARYNAAGERLNISMEVAVVVLGSGTDWVDHGSLRYVTVHDRLNDEMN